MPVLNIAIGKSKYTIDCEAGDEDNVLELANKLNERVNNLSLAMRGADEKTILMLSALSIQDDLENAKNSPKNYDESSPKNSAKDVDKIVEEKLIEQIGEVTNSILNLVKKIENV